MNKADYFWLMFYSQLCFFPAGSDEGYQSPPGSLWQHACELWPPPVSPAAVSGQDKPLPVQPHTKVEIM